MNDQRLPKQEIIRKREVFKEVFQNGKRLHGKYLRFYFMEAKNRQIGFLVPKKVGIAVKRNKIKRLMREVYRIHRSEIKSQKIIILAEKGVEKLGFKNIEKEFLIFLKKARISKYVQETRTI
jgi:ribonuclease P protein component